MFHDAHASRRDGLVERRERAEIMLRNHWSAATAISEIERQFSSVRSIAAANARKSARRALPIAERSGAGAARLLAIRKRCNLVSGITRHLRAISGAMTAPEVSDTPRRATRGSSAGAPPTIDIVSRIERVEAELSPAERRVAEIGPPGLRGGDPPDHRRARPPRRASASRRSPASAARSAARSFGEFKIQLADHADRRRRLSQLGPRLRRRRRPARADRS